MHFIYIDDSKDEDICVFSAISVPASEWQLLFKALREYRKAVNLSDGILMHKEFHAWKLVSGRGSLGDSIVTKSRRCEIFKECLRLLADFESIRVFNVVAPLRQDERAFERLLNRINTAMTKEDSHAVVVSDAGKEVAYTKLCRRLHSYNPIPSKYGRWDSTDNWKNIPIERIIEDPFFKDSKRSYLIQWADLCAYALLRKERPLASKNRYGIHEAFRLLDKVLQRPANPRDPDGIIRV